MEKITVENYYEKRAELVKANSNLLGVVLNEKEKELSDILEKLKREYKESCGGKVPYNIPVLTDKSLVESDLYKFCSMLPKGADLHVHDMSVLPISELKEVLKNRDEYYINTDKKHYDLITVYEGEKVPEGYMRFRDALESGTVTDEELLYNWTVLGAEKFGIPVWEYFEELFCRHAAISNNDPFAVAYYNRAFRYYCEHGIMHVEIHLLLSDDMDKCASYIKTVRQVYYDVKRDYPYFSVKIIGAGMKADSDRLEITKKCYVNSLFAQETIKDESDPDHITNFVIGFDLINEEDSSLPLTSFVDMLLKAHKNYPEMKFYIHGGESLEAQNDNLIDAYLLGVSRVGHGLNLYRYPDLLERYAKSEICLEVCVISNQTLGYTKDIRNHPAAEYLRRGIAIALCSDDPTYQENEILTDDFFAAAVCWDLNIADLKQLAINSITYSGLDTYEKTKLLKAYRLKWTEFVDKAIEVFKD